MIRPDAISFIHNAEAKTIIRGKYRADGLIFISKIPHRNVPKAISPYAGKILGSRRKISETYEPKKKRKAEEERAFAANISSIIHPPLSLLHSRRRG